MAKHLKIEGRVQGVGYRASLAALAGGLGLAGWVRNRQDGTVEAVAEGSGEALERLITWAHRGPPAAEVTQVTVTETSDDTGIRSGPFEIRPTA